MTSGTDGHAATDLPTLRDRVAIVSGAGTGLGREIARLYALAGAQVMVGDILDEHGGETVRLIEEAGGQAAFVHTDVTDDANVAELVRATEERYGALHIMTANAGILGRGHGKAFVDLTDADFAQIMDVNFHGIRRCFRHAVPAIRRAGGGAMTATGSLSGHRGYSHLAAYSSSKGAILALVRALAAELAPEIRVNAVSPGSILTQIRQHAESAGATTPGEGSAPRRPGNQFTAEPREAAWPHLFLVSDQAAFVNGQVIIADGGRSILPGQQTG